MTHLNFHSDLPGANELNHTGIWHIHIDKSLYDFQAKQLHDTCGAEAFVTIKSKDTGKTYSYASHPVQMAHVNTQAAFMELQPLGPLPKTRSTGSPQKSFSLGRPIQNLPGISNTNRNEQVPGMQGALVVKRRPRNQKEME